MDNVNESIITFSSPVNEQEQPKPLPKGRYKATIRSVVSKTSQRNTKYAEILFFIGPDQYPADYVEGSPDGVSIAYRRISLEDNHNSRWRLRKFCEDLGAQAPARELDLSDWVAKDASVTVDHETYEGVTRAVIQGVSAI